LIKLLDQAGIRRAALFSIAYQFGNPNRPPIANEYEQVQAENDRVSREVARYPDRLRGFCGVNPLKDYALAEIARCAKDPQMRFGLKLHFGNSDVQLEEPRHVARLREVFRAANDARMAIVMHVRSTISQRRPYGATQARALLTEVLPSAPDVPIQIAHLAGGRGGPGRRPQQTKAGRDGSPCSGLWRAPSYGLSPRADTTQRGRSRPEDCFNSYTPNGRTPQGDEAVLTGNRARRSSPPLSWVPGVRSRKDPRLSRASETKDLLR
jgi:predicted TIM-barrel fold metal-dependent hydrolase